MIRMLDLLIALKYISRVREKTDRWDQRISSESNKVRMLFKKSIFKFVFENSKLILFELYMKATIFKMFGDVMFRKSMGV